MHPHTIKLTRPLGRGHTKCGSLISWSFLQIRILLFAPITIWLSSLKIHFFHSCSTVQFFLPLAHATRLFLFTSRTVTLFLATLLLYPRSWIFLSIVFLQNACSLFSLNFVVMSAKDLLRFCFTTLESSVESRTVNNFFLPLPDLFSTEPVWLNFLITLSIVVLGIPKSLTILIYFCCLRNFLLSVL